MASWPHSRDMQKVGVTFHRYEQLFCKQVVINGSRIITTTLEIWILCSPAAHEVSHNYTTCIVLSEKCQDIQ
jgi:hypothetical protein